MQPVARGVVEQARFGRQGVDQQSRSAGVRRRIDVRHNLREQTAGSFRRHGRFRYEQRCTNRGVNVALRRSDPGPALVRQDEASVDRRGHIVRMALDGIRMPKEPIRRHLYLGQSRCSYQASHDGR